jgi:hypothetical protein
MAKPKPRGEIKMAVTRRGGKRMTIGRHSGRKKGDTEKITIRGEEGKEQEVAIRHEAVPQKKASSVWSWYEEFAAEWSETFITKKKKENQ